MRAEDLEPLREHMLAVIAAGAFRLRDAIGKNALDERVMTAMGKVPWHEFVPIDFSPTRMTIFHFQSVSRRPSRSHLSSP